jgi:hypothetical protein
MKDNKNKLLKDLKKNALSSNTFGGKRFLGLTKNGGEVWVSYSLSKDTYDFNVSLTHDLSSLLEEGAILAERRVSLKKGTTQRYTAQEMVRSNLKNAGGKVSKNTLIYLQKLVSAVESKNGIGYIDGKPTTSLFMLVSNFIYEGGAEVSRNEFRWIDVVNYWDLPRGKYFTLEKFPVVEVEK